jgi:hypothetical protein
MIDDVFQALHARVHQAHAIALQLSDDGEWSKAIALDLTRDVEPARECELSERSLDRDLPCRDDAEPHLGR